MKRKILLDGDVLLHQTANQSARKLDWGDGRWSYVGDATEGIGRFLGFCLELLELYPGELVICFSCKRQDNFRLGVNPEYKANRNTEPWRKPPNFKEMRDQLINENWLDSYRVEVADNLEADDILGLLAKPEDIIVSIDKDMMTIPCHHVNLRRLGEEPLKIHPIEAEKFFMVQAIMGDSVDGIKGVKGIGKVRAERMLEGAEQEDFWPTVVAAYEKAKYAEPEQEALMTARLVYILKEKEDYNWKTGEVKLWTP